MNKALDEQRALDPASRLNLLGEESMQLPLWMKLNVTQT